MNDDDIIAGTALVVTPDEVELVAKAICGSGWKYCSERYRESFRRDAQRALDGLRQARFIIVPPPIGTVT